MQKTDKKCIFKKCLLDRKWDAKRKLEMTAQTRLYPILTQSVSTVHTELCLEERMKQWRPSSHNFFFFFAHQETGNVLGKQLRIWESPSSSLLVCQDIRNSDHHQMKGKRDTKKSSLRGANRSKGNTEVRRKILVNFSYILLVWNWMTGNSKDDDTFACVSLSVLNITSRFTESLKKTRSSPCQWIERRTKWSSREEETRKNQKMKTT
jgi:hypothetical protein